MKTGFTFYNGKLAKSLYKLNDWKYENGTWNQLHIFSETYSEKIGKMAFPFLDLLVELQDNVVNNISCYCELKALHLISKTLYDVITPHFYYKVDLCTRDMCGRYRIPNERQDQQMLSKIHSLIKPANLCLVRVLKTGWQGYKSTILMNEVLPLLRMDSLIRFEYFTGSKFCFPTPRQLDSLYSRQKRLQRLQLHSHMVPWFAELEREHIQNVLLESLTEGDIGDRVNSSAITPDQVYWLFRNVKFCLLKRLSLNGQDSSFVQTFLS